MVGLFFWFSDPIPIDGNTNKASENSQSGTKKSNMSIKARRLI